METQLHEARDRKNPAGDGGVFQFRRPDRGCAWSGRFCVPGLGADVEVGVGRPWMRGLRREPQRQGGGDQHAVRDIVAGELFGVVLEPVAPAGKVGPLVRKRNPAENGGVLLWRSDLPFFPIWQQPVAKKNPLRVGVMGGASGQRETTAVASISTRAAASTRRTTWTSAIAG
jgi:hypothetical protein